MRERERGRKKERLDMARYMHTDIVTTTNKNDYYLIPKQLGSIGHLERSILMNDQNEKL